MPRPPLEVADLVRAAGERFVEKSRAWLSGQHLKVLSAIERCRTAALGGHLDECTDCGHRPPISYNSCRDRHCPKCQAHTRQRWLEARRKELLPLRYLHVVFTLPRILSQLALQNKPVLYSLLLRASAQTLLKVARDPRHLGAEIGFFSILHTWNQKLQEHAHAHTVVPAGGLSPDRRRWIDSPSKSFFLPQDVLAEVFRGKFVDGLQKAFAEGRLRCYGPFAPLSRPRAFQAFVRTLYRNQWVVEVRPPFGGPGQALRYLSRYTHRVAISNQRLVSLEQDQVTFRWRDSAHGNQQRLMTLALDEFLRRFLLHPLPPRFVRIRYYGLLAHRKRGALLPLCRTLRARVSPSPTISYGDDEPARTGGGCPRSAGAGGSSSASAPLSCASAPRLPSPPPEAISWSSSIHSVASARIAFVRLDGLPRLVLLVPAAFSAAERPAFPAAHRFPCRSPIPLWPSQGSQPPLTAFGPPDSKPIDPQPSSSGSLHIVVTQATRSLAPRRSSFCRFACVTTLRFFATPLRDQASMWLVPCD